MLRREDNKTGNARSASFHHWTVLTVVGFKHRLHRFDIVARSSFNASQRGAMLMKYHDHFFRYRLHVIHEPVP